MTDYQIQTQKPTRMLALIAALIVKRFDPSWLSAPVRELAGPDGPSMERLSRLKASLLPKFEKLLTQATHRGRSAKEVNQKENIEIHEELLALAASLVEHVSLYRRDLQDRLVQAYERLHESYGLSAKNFCAFLGLKERTLRSWRGRPAQAPKSKEPQAQASKKPKGKARNPGRFDLVRLVPGIQAMADTTCFTLLGCTLKLIGLQDPGKRLSRLFEGIGVYTQERATEVVDLIKKTIADLPGLQLITDQGSPFLADAARQAYEDLDLDHAPQKEGTPTAKAPLERAFGTVKQALAPIFDLTNRLAQHWPALRQPQLAQSLGQLLVAVFLRVYILAAKDASHPLISAPASQIELIAQQQRQDARQEENSKRLLLKQIHEAYAMPGSHENFVRTHRHHALEDIKEADRILRTKACRCQTKACDRYFAGILRNVAERGRIERAHERKQKLERIKEQKEQQEAIKEHHFFLQHPDLLLLKAFDYLSFNWLPQPGYFLLDGHGPGRAMIKRAIPLLAQKNPWTFQDDIQALWSHWKQNHQDLDPRALSAIYNVVYSFVKEQRKLNLPPSTSDCINAIFKYTQSHKPHSPPQPDLADLCGNMLG